MYVIWTIDHIVRRTFDEIFSNLDTVCFLRTCQSEEFAPFSPKFVFEGTARSRVNLCEGTVPEGSGAWKVMAKEGLRQTIKPLFGYFWLPVGKRQFRKGCNKFFVSFDSFRNHLAPRVHTFLRRKGFCRPCTCAHSTPPPIPARFLLLRACTLYRKSVVIARKFISANPGWKWLLL